MLSLFDLTFKKFVTPTVAKIVYILAMIFIAVSYIGFTVAAFNVDSALGVLVLLVLGPLGSLLYLCLFRVVLESLLSMILTAQNTAELVRLQQASSSQTQPVPGSPFSGPQGQQGPQGPYGYPNQQ
ncbi:protein of unknown function [Amycolatopsis marina]|uniref:DUF4282 domain-containing protein n=1 Tax=Amycolatopsis marina TaxID=490629 RepID=A0A1I0XWS3_9PSEU|nr:DUF4282 domain-containing protein [Amycolatopsis marina]SFB05462.1 protein of unknown function [Amycolatopsis marina]